MSSNKTLIVFVAALWTVIGAYYFIAEKKNQKKSHSFLELEREDYPGKMTAKLSAGVNVSFDMVSEDPKANEEIDVIAKIRAISDPGDYTYKIFMPGNSELVSTPQEGSLQLEINQDYQLPIRFSQSVDYDMKVHVEIRKLNSPNASMFTFSTLSFQKNKEELEALQERKAAYSK